MRPLERMNFWYWLGRLLCKGLTRTFARVEVVGRENIPPFGALIITPNHLNNADPPLVAAVFNRPLYFMGKNTLFINAFVAYFLRAFHVHPMQRNSRSITAIRWCLRQLDQDRAVVLFPEGTRSRGSLQKAGDGAAYLALKSRAPILPVAITGTEHIPNYLRAAFPFRRMKVVIGQAYSLPMAEEPFSRPLLTAMTTFMMERIADLLPPEYRGIYGGTAASR